MKFVSALFLIPLALAAQNNSVDDDIVWLDNYQAAVKEARVTGKPIFLEYRCEP